MDGGTDTASALSAASSRDEALAWLIRARRATPPSGGAILARDPASPRRLSYQQERLFALDQIFTNLIAYNQAQAFRLLGRLDLDVLAAAVREVQLRHDILRTSIRVADGDIVLQPVEPRPMDRIRAPAAAGDAAIATLVTAEVRRPLDLAANGPLRTTLITLGDEDHVLVVSLHHIACDDVSKRVIFGDLESLYDALTSGSAPQIARPALQFCDYADWQRRSLEHGDMPAALSWWADYLAGAPTSTTLPLDRPRPAIATNHGAKLRSRLHPAAMDALTGVARAAGATPFMALLAGFVWLLEQYGGDGEAVVGMPVSGRDRDELRLMVGLFLNTLPVRIATAGNPTFAELLARVRESVVGVLAHQQVPFELILDVVRSERDASRAPVSQVMCTMRSEPGTQPNFAGMRVKPINYDGGWTKFDLGLTGLLREDGALELLWQYNTDLFDRVTIYSLADHLSEMLIAAGEDPHRPMSEIAAPSVQQAELVISEWNDTAVDDIPKEPYHRLMQAQVDRTPNAVAVVDRSRSWTFRQLDERANQIAHELLARGVVTGDIIAVAMQRSTECEAAILGVLKAGAAYLPLDSTYPPARQEFVLRDSDARVVLTDRASAPSIPLGTPRIVLDAPTDPIRGRSEARPDIALGPDDLAYVIYTSGSTGQPKGVLCEHGGLVNRLIWMVRRFAIGPGDILLQKTPMSFDVSLTELLLPPICGASIVMAAPGRHGDPQYLRKVIDEHGVTSVHFVPSMLAAFLLATPVSSCPSLRLITASGEALSLETAHWCRELIPHAELYNLYGPTEASIEVTATPALEINTPRMTIGRPIDNIRTYVLDERCDPVPVGAIGELYLAGVGVARGYLNRDELTAERFLTDPFKGGRMYRTGDRARQLPDGQIEYLGRFDHQVKLRGFRIELGEIESALRSLDGVADAICDVRRSGADDLRLVGYVIPVAGGIAIEPPVIRRQLAALLPEYAVPSTVILIDALPLSANGKASRSLLPDPVSGSTTVAAVAPRTDLERAVAAVWASVLNVDGDISVHDNFYDVGGHSLLAIRLFANLEKTLRITLPLSRMIAGMTIADTAKYIHEAREPKTSHHEGHVVSSLIVAMRTSGELAPLFAMPGLRGDVLVYRQLLSELDARRPVYGVQCRGTDGRAVPRTTISDIAGDCVAAMRSVQPEGPYHLFGYCFSGIVAYETARQLTSSGEEVAFLGIIDATPPRGGLPTGGRRRWSRRWRLLAAGGMHAKLDVILKFGVRQLRRRVAEAYVRLGRRVPPAYVDFYAANRRAQLSYVPPPADVRVTLICKADEGGTETLPQDRWIRLAKRGLDVVALEAKGSDHHMFMQSRFAGRVAHAVNHGLGATSLGWDLSSASSAATGRTDG